MSELQLHKMLRRYMARWFGKQIPRRMTHWFIGIMRQSGLSTDQIVDAITAHRDAEELEYANLQAMAAWLTDELQRSEQGLPPRTPTEWWDTQLSERGMGV